MIAFFASLFAGRGLKIALGALAVVAVFAAIQTVRIEGVWCSDDDEKPACLIRGFKQELQIVRINLAEAEAYGRAEAAKHKATKRAYAEAQAEAAAMEAARIERVIEEQERITDEVETQYRRELVAVRARADRLRAQAEAATRGSGAAGAASDLQLPEAGDAAARADEAPDCRALPARDTLTEIRCREIAEAQATQLDALISWVERQFRVEP